MDYLDQIKKIAFKFVNEADAERCRRGLQEIIKYINDEDMNYRIRSEHRRDKGMVL